MYTVTPIKQIEKQLRNSGQWKNNTGIADKLTVADIRKS